MTSRRLTVVRSRDVSAKELVKGIFSKRLITQPKEGSDKFMLSLVTAEPGSSSTGAYQDKDEAIYVLKGQLEIRWEGNESTLSPGDTIFIPMGVDLEWTNVGSGDVEAIAVIAPSKTAREL